MITLIIGIFFVILLVVGAGLVSLVAAVGSIFAAPLAMDILMCLVLIKYVKRKQYWRKKIQEQQQS